MEDATGSDSDVDRLVRQQNWVESEVISLIGCQINQHHYHVSLFFLCLNLGLVHGIVYCPSLLCILA